MSSPHAVRTQVHVYNSVVAAVVPAYGEVLIRLLARSGLTTPLLPIRAMIATIGGHRGVHCLLHGVLGRCELVPAADEGAQHLGPRTHSALSLAR